MKMIMSLRAEDAGKVTQSLSPGAIVAPGQLLATLDLKDPSSVQTVKTFSGEYPLQVPEGSGSTTAEIEETLMAQLSGYAISPNMASTSGTSLVQALFSVDADAAIDSTSRLLACFLQNEAHFAGLVGGDETQIIPKFAGESTDLFAQMVAHHALPESLATVAALLRTLRSRIREGDKSINLPDELVAELKQISALPVEGGYGEVALLANGLMEEVERGDALSVSISKRREEIKDPGGDPEEGPEGARAG
jgi:hypothetical protein